MINYLEAFKNEQDHLLSAYQRLPELGEQWLKQENISVNQIEQWKSELSANRFKLCVAGQMNSGKSTLINALLFGRIVLPVLDTVMTSTITLIEHASQHPSGSEGARVEFYSQDEWDHLRQQMISDESNANKFEDAVTRAREVGVLAVEIVGSAPHILSGFEGLDAYIAPMEKKGRYTPFVKQVTVYADNPLLKDLVVVDTPGINDPNQIRAKLTEDWMRQADAVLYVTYAGQALSAPDVDFINRFMFHVASTHRIVAINKVDSVTDESQLARWLENLRNCESESLKQVFASTTPTILVSALGGLLENPIEPLDGDSKWYRDKLDKAGFLNPERHGLGKLKAAIESRLVQNKGESLLAAHRAKVHGVCTLVDNSIRTELASLKQKILDSSQSREALDKERGCLLDANNLAEKLYSKFRNDSDVNQQLIFRNLDQAVSDIREQFAGLAEGKLASKTSVSAVMEEAAWVAKVQLENSCLRFSERAEEHWGELHADLNRNLDGLKSDLAGTAGLNIETIELIIDRASLIALGGVSLEHCGLGKSDLDAVAQQSQGVFLRFINGLFGTGMGKEAVVSAVLHDIKDKIYAALQERVKFARGSIIECLDEFRASIQTEITKAVEKRTENISAILQQGKDMDVTIKQWAQQKNLLDVELLRVTTLINSLQ